MVGRCKKTVSGGLTGMPSSDDPHSESGSSPDPDVYIALVHYPVLSKNGEIICSAVTNLDIHDIARAGKTYGVKGYFVITILQDQRVLVEKIMSHWIEGHGGKVNPDRREALKLIRLADSIDEAALSIESSSGGPVTVVATTARYGEADMTFDALRSEIAKGGSFLLLFGTAWGLADDAIQNADRVLYPLQAGSSYNHLSVRSAVAIILDRLMAC